jgi:hypothetical protein
MTSRVIRFDVEDRLAEIITPPDILKQRMVGFRR